MADWQTKLNDCLAAEGVDPNRKRQPNGGSQAAYTKCYAEVGPPPQVDGPPRPSREESLKMDLAFAKCMREAGYDYPDPDPDADDTSAGQAVSPGTLTAQSSPTACPRLMARTSLMVSEEASDLDND